MKPEKVTGSMPVCNTYPFYTDGERSMKTKKVGEQIAVANCGKDGNMARSFINRYAKAGCMVVTHGDGFFTAYKKAN